MELPPRDVPEGLSPPEYFQLAQEYKNIGWIEQSRDASMLAIELGADSDTAKIAKLFLKTKIPKFPVPLLAEQRFIEGFNQMAQGGTVEALETFEELVKDYPEFEWAHGNLAVLYLQDERVEEAKALLTQALAINPDYVNGWLHMATAHNLELNFDEAKRCVERALQSDPTDPAANAMKGFLDDLDQD